MLFSAFTTGHFLHLNYFRKIKIRRCKSLKHPRAFGSVSNTYIPSTSTHRSIYMYTDTREQNTCVHMCVCLCFVTIPVEVEGRDLRLGQMPVECLKWPQTPVRYLRRRVFQTNAAYITQNLDLANILHISIHNEYSMKYFRFFQLMRPTYINDSSMYNCNITLIFQLVCI